MIAAESEVKLSLQNNYVAIAIHALASNIFYVTVLVKKY